MSPYIAVHLDGAEIWLLAEKAVYYPAYRALLIADVHFGKAAAFRALGQPVPQGTTQDNLQRLDQLLRRYPCDQLIFLGDFLHARQSRTPSTLQALGEWRSRHPELTITLIRGNHDKHAGDPPSDLMIETVPEPLLLGPFALQHEPHPHPTHHVLAGHVHPVYHLQGRGRQRLRLPCFYLNERTSLLPAFGAFTGGYSVEREQNSKIFVVGDGAVWATG
ncbi:DEAD/DEAH box helicase [Pseudomonas sp. S25]|uniref:DEAD/DEAH box helicase n=1 Tax=Pseudomonas maioricensis TaxID=1766623 RepID=A0ABS9ZGR2_9PSED|nr:ligase-associated DNA damage response endonuclease PdeM [Pseudomonas sp. S25]MCI8209526.1 DEAD/DEAH box helicase [Pseudomonas sp. S25]